ncbi:alpha/beta hydrolase [Paenibacillus sp. UMB4589-SE434]|uniref:alpha/beta fold hydrolase n=1 Tax=Paenibacillus sp. UMB4589-SE434 TaxID=3046314 RepID=UPI00254D94F8|nr:alpha/beta hydrolase [Paenibacillus sp. UMB4589-SE434]MDK8183756.1 alpha/beta hydrolase [Paenibacillus sp. UMB4589-SE434]
MPFIPETAYTHSKLQSADGTWISFSTIGSGPGIVILHGTCRSAYNYKKLAEELADKYTVHLMDRRGREASGPQGADYAMEKEIADTGTVLQHTGSTILFGHSYGGLVALETARVYAVTELVVYEPAVSITQSIPCNWLPRFEQAMEEGRQMDAFISFLTGLGLDENIQHMPEHFVKSALQAMSQRSPDHWNHTLGLLPTIVPELKEVQRLDSTLDNYRSIAARTLLISGANSPLYMGNPITQLLATLPEAQHQILPQCGHNGPDEQAPSKVAALIQSFLREQQGNIIHSP